MSGVLTAREIGVRYGGAVAVHSLSLEIEAGDALLILGPNGAGKSSTLMALSGLVKTSGGVITVNGTEAQGRDPRWFVKHGIALVPEGTRTFGSLSVLDNLLLPTITMRRSVRSDLLPEVLTLFPILAERRDQRAGTLSGGEQKMLAIGRGLMTDPAVLLIDEPTLGLAPSVIGRIAAALGLLVQRGISVVVAEQRLAFAEVFKARVMILERGNVTWGGHGDQVVTLEKAQEVLLGRGVAGSER